MVEDERVQHAEGLLGGCGVLFEAEKPACHRFEAFDLAARFFREFVFGAPGFVTAEFSCGVVGFFHEKFFDDL